MNILQTHFPKIAVHVAKGNAKAALERMKIPLDTALSNLNVIINKIEMRESMDTDEHLDVGAARNLLLQIEAEMDVVKRLLTEE